MLRPSNSWVSLVAALAIASSSLLPAAAAGPRTARNATPTPRDGSPLANVAGGMVTTYHADAYRSGQYVVPTLTYARAAKMHLVKSFGGIVDGSVYAQPLYWQATKGESGVVVVATETNHVTALDATTGSVVWDRHLAPAVAGGTLPCGNIAPEGITGTPAIDPASGTLYLAATIVANGTVESLAYALSLKTGRVLPGWPVNVGAALSGVGFSPLWQGERGALAVSDGHLYVPYGGRSGDCDDYHGAVVAIALAHPAVSAEWQTQAVRGGVWSVGGVTMADGDIYVTTGNTSGASTWSGGEAIVKLPPALTFSGDRGVFFAPANWQDLDQADKDLGGTGPTPLDIAGRKLIVALGKDGNAYLADRTDLGAVGGQLDVIPASTGEIIGGPASWVAGNAGYVVFQGNAASTKCSAQGLTTLKVVAGAKPHVAFAWCSRLSGAGDPIVTTTDGSANRIVWAVGADGDGQLHGYAASNGAVVYAGGGSANVMQNLRHMSTILAAQGRLYVPSDNRIYAFTP